ncbi:Sugar phosphate permease [Aliiroseovarius halocynthiae]|uniref:MFS transporter n=1 Tax=Aliiroseovarius halocynthiae TaxID=985055 RepID=A0A545SZQ2_9RHOB|nr:MFS transporter [Aliiroseovarius halocynthiae]TQV70411.1 MFS transporter [Aliiroseovarius halocynthiae]SMR81873.1 Sugar phosphate permease [Aliiroseovarius halocynthiae]
MRAGIITLIAAYVLSQFYRAFLAVMTPALKLDLGATPEDLARASGAWFLVFALMQIPVGWALDNIGPRKVAAGLLAVGGAGGAALFAMASSPDHILYAMVLIGIGCSPVLMASYFIFARMYSPKVFGTLAGMVIGIGSLGNIAGALPMALAVEQFGWRTCLWALAAVTLVVAALIMIAVDNPPKATAEDGAQKGSVLDLLKMPALWAIFPIMFVNYTAAAGLRGSWAGPYLRDVYGLDTTGIGWATMAIALAMVIGSFAYGPLDRVFGTRKWVIFFGNLIAVGLVFLLWAAPDAGVWRVSLTMAAIGLFAASFPLIMAHARSFYPPHLVGRGVTLLNMFGIGGVGIFQYASASVFKSAQGPDVAVTAPYQAVFLFFAVPGLIGCLLYLLSQDRTD